MASYRIPENNYETSFYYALNSRGDVIGLYSANGTLIAKYTYDVWGNVLFVTNSTGTEIIANTMESTIIGAVVGKTVPTVKVSGVTAGRNSMGAVYKSGLTKLINKTASKMSPKVVGKGIVSETVKDSGCSAVMGLLTSIDNFCKSYFK